MKYLIDTSIWIDLYEDRKGYNSEPLGEYALKLFSMIRTQGDIILVSDILLKELEQHYSMPEINGMFKSFDYMLEKKMTDTNQNTEAKAISILRNVPLGDVLHAILARDNDATLITRDKHFRKLEDISSHYKPEDII